MISTHDTHTPQGVSLPAWHEYASVNPRARAMAKTSLLDISINGVRIFIRFPMAVSIMASAA
jgi:hypothetical protein